MALTITIDRTAFCLIHDLRDGRIIGSAFVFLRPRWIVTAKHVVVHDGLVRPALAYSTVRKCGRLKVIVVDPDHDLAILEAEVNVAEKPLLPTYGEFATIKELIAAGYKPSGEPDGLVAEFNHIDGFEIETRERVSGSEQILLFKDPGMEGGHSGGAVLAEGSNVAAVVIEHFERSTGRWARATSILHLMKYVSLSATSMA